QGGRERIARRAAARRRPLRAALRAAGRWLPLTPPPAASAGAEVGGWVLEVGLGNACSIRIETSRDWRQSPRAPHGKLQAFRRPTSNLQNPTSNLQNPTSNPQPPEPNLQPPTY